MRSRAPTATESVCLGRHFARAALDSYTYCPTAARSKLTRRRSLRSGEARLGHAHHIHVVRARRTRHRGAQTFNSVARNPFNPVTPARADAARLELHRAIVYEWVEPQAPARVCPPLQNVSSPATEVCGEKLSGVRRMETKEKAEAERLKQDEEVKRALDQTGGQALKEAEAREQEAKQPPRQAEKSHKFWAGTYLILLVALGVLYYALRLNFFDRFFQLAPSYRTPVQRTVVGAMCIVLVLTVAKGINAYLISTLEDAVSRYNLSRILRLLTVVAVLFIALSVLFANCYTAAVSFGLLSLILGFALQTPTTSLLGWIYILVRAPYPVGDRIRIGNATGDVIDVSYLDTTLWEFGGEFLSTDHPSGRVIKFPNSGVLNQPVWN